MDLTEGAQKDHESEKKSLDSWDMLDFNQQMATAPKDSAPDEDTRKSADDVEVNDCKEGLLTAEEESAKEAVLTVPEIVTSAHATLTTDQVEPRDLSSGDAAEEKDSEEVAVDDGVLKPQENIAHLTMDFRSIAIVGPVEGVYDPPAELYQVISLSLSL